MLEMANVQLLQIEVQNLKDALDTSQKKADRYSQLATTLSDELNKLQSNICDHCKKRLVPGSGSVSTSPGLNDSTTISSTFWRRLFQNCQLRLPSRHAVDVPGPSPTPTGPTVPTITSKTAHGATADAPTTNSGLERTPISPEPKSQFSVVSNFDATRTLDLHFERVFTHEYPAWCVNISPDGQRMVVGFQNSGETIVNEVKTRSNIRRVFVDRYVKDHLSIWCVKFSPDGRLLATGANDCRIRIWDITQNRMRALFKGHENGVNGIAFSPDGRSLVSASDDHSARIWNIRDGSSKKLPAVKAGCILSIALSPDGRYIAAGDTKKSLWIWNSRTLKLMANWKGHRGSVWCLGFTPDGKGLLSGSKDATIQCWDVSSLEIYGAVSGGETVDSGHPFPLIQSLSGHTGAVRSIAFFPNNSEWIITSSDDGTVRIWDIRTGVWQLAVQGHTESISEVDISGTENLLATASFDRHVTLWRYKLPQNGVDSNLL